MGECPHIERRGEQVVMSEQAHERLVAELTDLRNREAGLGDGVTQPPPAPKEVIERWHELFVEASDHFERCPAWCDDCEQWERPRSCTVCKGSGCGPGTALGAFQPCRECDGDARDHLAYKPTHSDDDVDPLDDGYDWPVFDSEVERRLRTADTESDVRSAVINAYSSCFPVSKIVQITSMDGGYVQAIVNEFDAQRVKKTS